jgi:hypothetical protein
VLRQAAALAGAGLVLGRAASLALTWFLATLLFKVRAMDAATLGATARLLAAVALAANDLPARRASGVDPTTALRCEWRGDLSLCTWRRSE